MSGHVVKIVIENTKPPIWRRIVLPEKIQFDDLHEIIQMTFGWKDVYDHEFSFPYGNLRILPSPDTNSYRTVAEDYVIYEDYLEEVNWIRYKYYSRDLIKHKIFYEKLDPTYKHRYATVLKVKGDDHRDLEYISFDDEKTSQTEEFSIEKINIELKQLVFPERKSRLEEIDKSRERELEEEIKRISEEIIRYKKQLGKFEKDEGNKLLQIRSASKKKSTSKIRLAIEEWEAFADLKLESINSTRVMKSGHLNNVDESHELKRNQITLFGEDSVKEEVTDKNIKIIFPKEKSEILLSMPSKSMKQYLNQLSIKELQMHRKFLQLDVPEAATKGEILNCMEVLLKKHPEYYLWAFSKAEWRALEKLSQVDESEVLPNIDTDSITKAISVGLLDCMVSIKNNNYSVTFTFATEMKDVLKTLNQNKSENLFRWLEKMDETINLMLMVYGMMDLESLYAAFKKFNVQNISYTEFKRLVYWRGIFLGYLVTFDNLIDGKSYAAAPQIDYDSATIIREEYMEEKHYKTYDKKSLMELHRGFNLVYESWQQYLEYLDISLGLDEESISDWLPEAYVRVLNGASSTEIINATLKMYEPRNILEYRELWYTLFYTVMETGLVGLKGYSREEYLEMGNEFPKLLPAVTNKKNVVKIGRTTHIYEMSQDIQLEIFKLSFMELSGAIKGMNSLINKYGNTNEELKLILAEMYDIYGDFNKAKKILLEIKLGSKKQDCTIEKLISSVNERIISDDFHLNYADEDMAKYINNVVQFPSKKISKENIKTVKIGRNDPCPCGSGKKYKNCCGK